MRNPLGVAIAACLVLAGTGCGSSSASGTPHPQIPGTADTRTAAPSGHTLWAVDDINHDLNGFDTGSGEQTVEYLEISDARVPDIEDMAVGAGKIWIARADGVLTAVDARTHEPSKALAITQDAAGQNFEYRRGIERIAVGDGSVYAAIGSQHKPRLVRLDAAGFAEQARASVVGDVDTFESVLYDAGSVWVLQGNGFEALEVDGKSLAVRRRVPLGLFPGKPDGPRGAHQYGDGLMVQVGGTLWVVENSNHELLRVDKATLAVKKVANVRDIGGADGIEAVAANKDSFFLVPKGGGRVVRFDGTTGQRVKEYALGEGGGTKITATDDTLYVNDEEPIGRVLAIDIRSGKTTRKFEVDAAAVALG